MGHPRRVLLIDVETTGLYHERGDRVWAVGWADWEEGCMGEVRLEFGRVHPRSRQTQFFPTRDLVDRLNDESLPKVAHNAMFDLEMLCASGLPAMGIFYDTLSLAHMLGARDAALKSFARELGFPSSEALPEEDLRRAVTSARVSLASHFTAGPQWQSDMWILKEFNVFPHYVDSYLRQDVEMLGFVWATLVRKLDESQWVFVERDAQLICIVYHDILERGVRIDYEELEQQINKCKEQETRYAAIFSSEVKRRFHMEGVQPGHQKVVRSLLFNPPPYGLGIRTDELTRAGRPRVRYEKLGDMPDPMLQALASYHRYEHYRTSILERLAQHAVRLGNEWRVYPRFTVTGTVSGRFSCREPNLQQLPNPVTQKSAGVDQPRRIVLPDPGKIWLGMDFKQMEARVTAVLSDDDLMIETLADPSRDLFNEMIDEVWSRNHPYDTIAMAKRVLEFHADFPSSEHIKEEWDRLGWHPGGSSELANKLATQWLDEHDWSLAKGEKDLKQGVARGCLKVIFYTAIYGGNPSVAAKTVRLSLSSARRVWDMLFDRFPGLKEFWNRSISHAKAYGWVPTVFGRRVYVPLSETYKAINYSVQGTCADMMKLAMLRVRDTLGDRGRIVITMHDELVVETQPEDLFDQQFLHDIELAFTDFHDVIPIPTPCDFEVYAHHWGESIAMQREIHGGRTIWRLPESFQL